MAQTCCTTALYTERSQFNSWYVYLELEKVARTTGEEASIRKKPWSDGAQAQC